jgi:branched-chain amino acid transport system substrate-binding protein
VKLALREAGGRVGAFTVNYVSLDAADPETGEWSAERVLANAETAIRDRNTIAYLGELDSPASALSLPLLNAAGVLQLSPATTYPGFTKPVRGRRGEPQRFYPSGERTFGRLVPTDELQAQAQARWMAAAGVRRLHVLHDGMLYGRTLAGLVAREARGRGIRVIGAEGVARRADDYGELAGRVAAGGADAVFFGGVTASGAADLFTALHAADAGLMLFGGDGLAESAFTEDLREATARRARLTTPALPPSEIGAEAVRFRAAFRAAFGRAPEPYAAYGYESMRAVLDAMRRAGARGNDRQAVVEAFYAGGERRSAVGRYDIDSAGDTTATAYGAYRVRDGGLALERVLRPQRRGGAAQRRAAASAAVSSGRRKP